MKPTAFRSAIVAVQLGFSGAVYHASAGELPLNPAVTPATVASTICQIGWTRTIRPYVSTMKTIKAEMRPYVAAAT